MSQVAGGGREAGGQLEKLGYAPVPEGLDLIETGEQITHQALHNPISLSLNCDEATPGLTPLHGVGVPKLLVSAHRVADAVGRM